MVGSCSQMDVCTSGLFVGSSASSTTSDVINKSGGLLPSTFYYRDHTVVHAGFVGTSLELSGTFSKCQGCFRYMDGVFRGMLSWKQVADSLYQSFAFYFEIQRVRTNYRWG